ncbi:MAG TPA: hypothetical protein VGM29_12695 [Polyangiaceae bacterium]
MTPARLMRYYDGELPEVAARLVEHELMAESELRGELQSYEAIGECVRQWAEQRSRGHDDLVDDVMRAIAGRPYSKRVPRRRSSHVLAWVSLSLGLAAGAALLMRTLTIQPAPASLVVPSAEHGAARSVAIESVDFGARGGTVFMVSTTSSDTPVVWTDDDDSDDDQRNEPL